MASHQFTLQCSRSLVGRIIGKQGVTIRGVQIYANVAISIDQQHEPAEIIICGGVDDVALAVSMVADMLAGQFNGFALLRELSSRSCVLPAVLRAWAWPPAAAPGAFG